MKLPIIKCLALMAALPVAGLAKDNSTTAAARKPADYPALLRAGRDGTPALEAAHPTHPE